MRDAFERAAWVAIVLTWFWPITLGVLSSLVIAYIIVLIIHLIAIAPIE